MGDRGGRRGVAVAVALALLAVACGGGPTSVDGGADGATPTAPPETSPEGAPPAPGAADGRSPVASAAPSPAIDPPPDELPEPPPTRDALVADLERLVAAASDRAPDSFGVLVTDEVGREVVTLRPDAPQLPASTLKQVTAAAILTTLGPQARLSTHVDATAGVDEDGRLDGDLLVVGGGDPTLVTDEYLTGVYPARPRTRLADLADQLVDLGLREVTGDVRAVAPGYDHQPLPEGWPDRYLTSFDGRHLAGLTVDAGLRTLVRYPQARVLGGADDDADEADEAEEVDGHAVVAVAEALELDDPPTSRDALRARVEDEEEGIDLATIDGTVLARLPSGVLDLGPVDTRVEHATDPVAHTGAELRRLLAERGVELHGDVVTLPPASPALARLATVTSPTVEDLLRFTIQRSDNHLADQLFLLAGRVRTGRADFTSAERALQQVLVRLGVGPEASRFADGSGLSRDDRLTPRHLVDLDRALSHSSRWGVTWSGLQAQTGVSGTLERRLRGTVAEGRFLGKTGTLRDVSALTGRVTARPDGAAPGERSYHLAVLATDAELPGRAVARALADELILTLVADLDGCAVRTPPDGDGPLGRGPREVVC